MEERLETMIPLRVAILVVLSIARSDRVCGFHNVLAHVHVGQQRTEYLFGYINSTEVLGMSFLLKQMPFHSKNRHWSPLFLLP